MDNLRRIVLVQTTPQDLLDAIEGGTISTNVFLRRLHTFCIGLNWLPWPILAKRLWPKVKHKAKRATTWEDAWASKASRSTAIWKQFGMKQAIEAFGRPPELSEGDMKALRALIGAGEFKDLEQLQKFISRTILQLEGDQLIPLAKARAIYRKALARIFHTDFVLSILRLLWSSNPLMGASFAGVEVWEGQNFNCVKQYVGS